MGEELSVCKRFYLATLGFQPSNDAVVQKALHSLGSGSLLPKPDGRGSGTHCAIDRNKVRAHIESFSPSISHYRREHAPHMQYLPSDITIDGMHKVFLQKNPNMTCSYEVYRTEVKKMCISFTKLGHEECELCESFSLHSAEHTRDNLNQTCDVCIKWQTHIRKAGESRQEYRNDSATENCNSSHVMFSADLQKVIMLPRMESIKTVLFTRRIVAFNDSFVPLGYKTTEKPVAVLWHEAVAGRKKEDIVSAFHAFLLARRDAKSVTLWLDNCAGQNKNWTLFSYLVYIVNSDEISADEIRLKFFEPGHTFMSADSFHHQAEQSLKKAGKVYDFGDFAECVQNANKGKVVVKEMQMSNYFEWIDASSSYKLSRAVTRPYLSDMVMVKAIRGSRHLLYKTAFNEEDRLLNFLTARYLKSGISAPPCRTRPRGIPQAKKTTF